MVLIIAQLHKYTKNLWITQYKQLKCMYVNYTLESVKIYIILSDELLTFYTYLAKNSYIHVWKQR